MNENCKMGECEDRKWGDAPVLPALPEDCPGGGEGGGGGGGEGHKYTFVSTATGWQVREDGRVIYTYTDKNDDTTYTWQATTEGWLVKDNKGNVVFNYTDKDKDTTYNFEQTDDCGIKVTDNTGKVVFEYKNECAGTTYKFEQTGVDFKVTNEKTNTVVFTYKGTVDTDTTYTYEDYKKGFKVTDSTGAVVYIYDPELGDRSDGSYPIDTLLTTVFKGKTTIATGQIVGFTPAKLVIGETLVYDGVGTVGVITKDNGDGTYEVTTMTISPGSRQGVRLGSVDEEDDLPATCADAEAKGWQTPQLGDFAYVIKASGSADDVISEYVITNVDDNCNLTWTFSHSFNAGQYQEQSTAAMAGLILTGGVVPGTFGTPLDPSTFIRGVMRNGILLTPDAQGKVNVIVDDAHVIVSELPTTDIKDHVEYIVIDDDKKVTSTWVHDPTGWYQTYEKPSETPAHILVDALPTTGILENVEYVVVDTNNKVTGTYVYNPSKGWLQTEKPEDPGHIVVDKLPTTGIDTQAEYVVVDDLDDPVATFKATYVYTTKGWIKTSTAGTGGGHIAVTALPTTGIVEGAEYIVMTDTSDPKTITGTWVRVNGNWVQTEKLDDNGFHIVTSLPTSNIDDKNTYIVVTDLNNPDTTFISQAAYDSTAKKWIDLTPKTTNVYYNMAREGEEVKWGTFSTPTATYNAAGQVIPWNFSRGTWDNTGAPAGTIKVPAGKTVEMDVYTPLKNTPSDTVTTAPDIVLQWVNQATGSNLGIGNWNSYTTGTSVARVGAARYTYSSNRSFVYSNSTNAPVYIQLKVSSMYQEGEIQGTYAYCTIKEIGRVVDPVAYLDQNGDPEDTPVGSVEAYMGKTAPTNWLICDGSTYNIGTYPELEAFIGDQYGRVNYFGGNGTTTWAVPDLRGEFLRGAGGTASYTRGEGATVGGHQDPTSLPDIQGLGGNNDGWVQIGNGGTENADHIAGAVQRRVLGQNGGYNVTGTHPNRFTIRPTNTSVNWIIKCQKTVVVVTAPTVDGNSVAYKMMTPSTWPAGVEQSFGNGIYGYRYVNNSCAVKAGRTDYDIITNFPTSAKFISYGGSVDRNTVSGLNYNTFPIPATWTDTAGNEMLYEPLIDQQARKLYLTTWDTHTATVKVDLWILYKK